MLMDIMVQPFKKYFHRDGFTTGCILLKDIIYSLVLASEKRGHLILNSYYTGEDTVIKKSCKICAEKHRKAIFWFFSKDLEYVAIFDFFTSLSYFSFPT